jgi:GT2 family glycosyltransferase
VNTRPRVAVCVVSHDSAADLPACLASVEALHYRPLELVVVDNASVDGSAEVALQHLPTQIDGKVVRLEVNLGFAGGMNRALAECDGELILSLNPDARPAPDCVDRLVDRILAQEPVKVGAVAARLQREAGPGEEPLLDACGMRLSLTWRHLDRGSGRRPGSRWERPERVFGATGALSLFNRAALDDVAVEGEVFDTWFHSFREDAELCFRLQERGWQVLYEPTARGTHRRANLPSRRRRMAARINYHSLKNRYLLRAFHQSGVNLLPTLVPVLWRDLLALGYVLLRERSSLAAYAWLWRHRREIARRRRQIQGRRTARRWEVERWFVRRGLPL